MILRSPDKLSCSCLHIQAGGTYWVARVHMGCKRPLGAITGIYALGMRGVHAFVSSTASHASRAAPCGIHRSAAATVRTSISTRQQTRFYAAGTSMSANGEGRKKVVFLGTPDIAASSLELLLEASRQGKGGGFDVVRAVSNPPARAGRKKVLQPSPVQALAESEGVPVLTPATARDEEFLAELEGLQPDLCVTAAYGQFLPRRFLDIPKFGTLNVHPSLLPLYRGASPVQRCLEAGDAQTGVTVAFTVLKMDSGPVVRQTVRERVRPEFGTCRLSWAPAVRSSGPATCSCSSFFARTAVGARAVVHKRSSVSCYSC